MLLITSKTPASRWISSQVPVPLPGVRLAQVFVLGSMVANLVLLTDFNAFSPCPSNMVGWKKSTFIYDLPIQSPSIKGFAMFYAWKLQKTRHLPSVLTKASIGWVEAWRQPLRETRMQHWHISIKSPTIFFWQNCCKAGLVSVYIINIYLAWRGLYRPGLKQLFGEEMGIEPMDWTQTSLWLAAEWCAQYHRSLSNVCPFRLNWMALNLS